MCASATIPIHLLIACDMDGGGDNLCHVTFIITIIGGLLVTAVLKTTRTYRNNIVLLVQHLAAIFLGRLLICGLLF